MDIIKGEDFEIYATVYQEWTGDAATSQVANCAGASVSCMLKNRPDDADASAVLNLNGSVVNAPNGRVKVPVTAAQTNALGQAKLYGEILVKLSGNVYRRAKFELNMEGNVIKVLP